jgi:hypothetical protein
VSYPSAIFKRERLRPVGLALLAAVIAGCGGEEGERLARDEWIARADSICAEASRELDALGEPGTPAELAELSDEAAAIAERQLDRLRDLRPPTEVEDDYTRMLDLTDDQIEISREIADAAREGDPAAVQALVEEGRSLDDEADELAARYGFEECGSD